MTEFVSQLNEVGGNKAINNTFSEIFKDGGENITRTDIIKRVSAANKAYKNTMTIQIVLPENWYHADWTKSFVLDKVLQPCQRTMDTQFLVPETGSDFTDLSIGELSLLSYQLQQKNITLYTVSDAEMKKLTNNFNFVMVQNTDSVNKLYLGQGGTSDFDQHYLENSYLYYGEPNQAISIPTTKKIDIDSIIKHRENSMGGNATIVTHWDSVFGKGIAIVEFGSVFWNHVHRYIPSMKNDIENHGVISIDYQDNYIRSPFSTMLIGEILNHVKQDGTDIKLTTWAVRGDSHHPYYLHDDWKNIDLQHSNIQKITGFQHVSVGGKIPHTRLLTLTLGNGDTYKIRLEHGIGCFLGSQKVSFPFSNIPDDSNKESKAIQKIIKENSLSIVLKKGEKPAVTIQKE